MLAKRLPDDALQAVSVRCKPTIFLGYGQPEPRLVACVFCCQHRKHVVATAARLFEHATESRSVRQAARSLKPVIGPTARHVIYFCLRRRLAPCRYGVSSSRPLARRRFSTRRPPLVAILARNPWVRARFNALGWYVRFIGLVPAFFRGRPRAKESGQAYAGTELVSIEQSVNTRSSRQFPFDGQACIDVLDCPSASDFVSVFFPPCFSVPGDFVADRDNAVE